MVSAAVGSFYYVVGNPLRMRGITLCGYGTRIVRLGFIAYLLKVNCDRLIDAS